MGELITTTSNLLFDPTRNLTSQHSDSASMTTSTSARTELENENSSWGEEYAKLYEAPAEVIAILSIFYGGISIVAIIGNTLVIWIVATTRQMHTVTNLYIANLAFADVIIGMFCIPFQFQAALLQRWNLPEFMCAFCPFIQVLSVNVSVFTLTAIAVDRHRAIINPLRARPTRFVSKLIIVAIWIAAVAFSIPCAIAFRVIEITELHKEDEIITNVTRPFCENVNLTEDELQTYRYYLVFVQYVVPLCVISFIYIQMAFKLWGSRTPGNAQDSRDITLLRNKKKVIKMLIIVVVVFGVCWLPLQTYNILYVTWPQINEYRFINIIWFCCDWLAMSNSCYNPFIYGIYNEKFKREFNRRFSVCFCKYNSHDLPDRTLSVYTRASSIRSNYTNHNNSTRYNRNNLMSINHQNNKRFSTIKMNFNDNNFNNSNNSNRSIISNNKSILLLENNENQYKNELEKFHKDEQQENQKTLELYQQNGNIYNTLNENNDGTTTNNRINQMNMTDMPFSSSSSTITPSGQRQRRCNLKNVLRQADGKIISAVFKKQNGNLNTSSSASSQTASVSGSKGYTSGNLTRIKFDMKRGSGCGNNLEMTEYPLLERQHNNLRSTIENQC